MNFFQNKEKILFSDMMSLNFENGFDFNKEFSLNLKFMDFKFFDNTDFLNNYDFQKHYNYFLFSDLFFFNSFESSEFTFLHRDFYAFYPIFKYMSLCDILLNKLTVEDIAYMRTSLVFADIFTNIKDQIFLLDPYTTEGGKFEEEKIRLLEAIEAADKFFPFVNSKFLKQSNVSHFFSCFIINEIFHQEPQLTQHYFYNYINKNNKKFVDKLSNEQRILFYYSANKGFNGILEMLHFFNKIHFPKRMILLKDLLVEEYAPPDAIF